MSEPFETENDCLRDALERCSKGEKDAFEDIYTLTSEKFTAIIQNMVHCEDTTRDILQRGYLSIWQNAGKFDTSRAKPFTWMLVIMRNRAIDVIRAKNRKQETEDLQDTLVDQAPRPETLAQAEQARRLLSQQLASLPSKTAEAIRLHIVEGYTCREIGNLLEASPHTVKSWIRRGLERIRTQMPYTELSTAL